MGEGKGEGFLGTSMKDTWTKPRGLESGVGGGDGSGQGEWGGEWRKLLLNNNLKIK